MHSGYAAIIGRPNVGKSTLLNAIAHQKLAAVSAKPQTTRHQITGIVNLKDAQIIFIDTPGFHLPDKALNKAILENVESALNDADVFCLMVEPKVEDVDIELFKRVGAEKCIVVVNKSDTVDGKLFNDIADNWKKLGAKELMVISALKNLGVEALVEAIAEKLPEGEPLFPDDIATTSSMRFIAAEHVRQEVFDQMRQEIPYSTAVVVEKFDESAKPIRISAAIIVERDSQKAMIIGSGGKRIKEIGIKARRRIEEILGERIFLELFVKVEKDWTKDEKLLKELMKNS